ncbi:hypothetical protein N7491_009916 [Penicillium cf. griseofulvum]|uniref:DUF6536 domain-containing protein n=1 Tax=Penicillium cf. griseofulvum TaxID=2972120 RepID=A0A9W9MYV5_9EURO|nr:hypothetical protein N7472_000243 [Penicillium cf. griseofulvum]KAJ5421471.1 hypothetical protein N7491_009916 [Penicillium cf. griseofulvum]KAJ5424703.1 hypothetical protein N7445_010676 [Penicillium cf. griseofulvum]
MSDRNVLGRGIELLPIPSRLKSAYHLLQGVSSRASEGRPRQNSSDDEEAQSNLKRSVFRYGSRFEGWKFTIFLAFVTSLIVLLFNVGFLLYTAAHPQRDDIELYPTEYQYAYSRGELHSANTVLYEGDCAKVHRLSTGFHLLVNFLSTALLSASNFGMTEHIGVAHGSILECLVSATYSGYNSAIYETTAVFAYDVFAGPGSLAHKDFTDLHLTSLGDDNRHSFQHLFYAARNGTLDRLQGTECLDAFVQTFQKTYSRLLIVTDDLKGNDSYNLVYTNPVFNPNEYVSSKIGPYDWLCPDDTQPDGTRPDCNVNILPNISTQITNHNWTVRGFKIDYCLAEKQEEHCKLQYSLPITMTVIMFNVFKAGILFYMWFKIPDTDTPILTIGDAIASFLRRPDRYTQGGCLLAYRNVRYINRLSPKALKKRPLEQAKPFSKKRRRWGSAVSLRRWTFSIILWFTAIAICVSLLLYGLSKIGTGVDIWKQELGSTVTDTLIAAPKWPNTLELNAFIANAPQLIFSFLYFAFNSLLTTMALAAEWSGYAIHRKGLRVSNNAQLSQRSQYFLSIPYRYSMPLLAASATLHWLISQVCLWLGLKRSIGKCLGMLTET